MLTKLIPAQYHWLAWLALASIIAAAGAWGGHKATATHYKLKVAEAEARAVKLKSAYDSMALARQRQNDAINQLQADAKAREKRAAQDVAQARAAAATSRDQATAIMGLKLPAGADECLEAREAFDDELRQERGKR